MRCIICYAQENAETKVIRHQTYCPDYVADPKPPRQRPGRKAKR